MATLTRQQLEANIQAMEKQGAKQPDIQAYLDSLKGQQGPVAPSNIGAPAQPKGDGFFKTLIKAPLESLVVKPVVRTAQAVEGIGRELGLGTEEKKQKYYERVSKDVKVPIPLLGDINVEPVKPGFAGVKQALGEGLEAGSYLVGGGGAAAVGKGAVKSTLGRGIAQGAKAGAKSGAIFGAGQGLQEDKDFGGVVGSTLTGATVGGVAGGAIGGALTGARHTLLGKQSTAEEARAAAGKVFQSPKARGVVQQEAVEKTGTNILSRIDTTGVKTYDDLSRVLESHIDRGLNEVDEAYKTSALKIPISKLDRVIEAKSETGRTIKASQNFVKEALQDMEELFTKTRNPAEKGRIKALTLQAKNEGLSPFEINQLAREYGTTFKKKAFGAQGPLTSVNAVTYENTRKGLKSTARSFLETEALQNLDEEVSQTIRLKKLTDNLRATFNALENRVQERNLFQKIARGVAGGINTALGGSPQAFFSKLLVPSGAELKTMNSIDLQNELAKNLRIIRNLEHASDSTVISALRNLAINAGLIKPVSVFGRTPAPKLGSKAIATGKAAVDKSVAKIPTARYTKDMPKSALRQTSKELEKSAKTRGRPVTLDFKKTSAQLEKTTDITTKGLAGIRFDIMKSIKESSLSAQRKLELGALVKNSNAKGLNKIIDEINKASNEVASLNQ